MTLPFCKVCSAPKQCLLLECGRPWTTHNSHLMRTGTFIITSISLDFKEYLFFLFSSPHFFSGSWKRKCFDDRCTFGRKFTFDEIQALKFSLFNSVELLKLEHEIGTQKCLAPIKWSLFTRKHHQFSLSKWNCADGALCWVAKSWELATFKAQKSKPMAALVNLHSEGESSYSGWLHDVEPICSSRNGLNYFSALIWKHSGILFAINQSIEKRKFIF